MFQTVVSDLKHEITARALKDAHFSVGTFWNQLDLADLYSVQRVKTRQENHREVHTVSWVGGADGLCCSQPPGAQELFRTIDELSRHC